MDERKISLGVYDDYKNPRVLFDAIGAHNEFIPVKTKLKTSLSIYDNEYHVVSAAAGDDHALVLYKNGDVYSFGYGESGQLGHPEGIRRMIPAKVKGLPSVKSIFAGSRSSAILSNEGDVYLFTIADVENDMMTIRKVDGLPKIKTLSIAGWYALFVSEEGEVFLYRTKRMRPFASTGLVELPAIDKLEGLPKVRAVSAGSSHAMMLTESGEVYSFGCGRYGKLGHCNLKDEHLPKRIKEIDRAKAVSAGENYSIVLLSNGDVISFGNNTFGELGHGNTDEQRIPKKIEKLKNIKDIAANRFGAILGQRSMFLMEDGSLYLCGLGWFRNAGSEKLLQILSPVKMFGLPKIKNVSVGGNYLVIVTEAGDYYSIGEGGLKTIVCKEAFLEDDGEEIYGLNFEVVDKDFDYGPMNKKELSKTVGQITGSNGKRFNEIEAKTILLDDGNIVKFTIESMYNTDLKYMVDKDRFIGSTVAEVMDNLISNGLTLMQEYYRLFHMVEYEHYLTFSLTITEEYC